MANKFHHIDISEKYAAFFAKKYVAQLTYSEVSPKDIAQNAVFKGTGFNDEAISKIIKNASIFTDPKIEQGSEIGTLHIYRSDLGELLLCYYFEESKQIANKFVIPYKNITYRERPDMPGKGVDIIGYRKEDDGFLELLIGEAKVSEEKASPPQVVHAKLDSIYQTHKENKENEKQLVDKLANYARKLPKLYASDMLFVILCIENKLNSNFNIVFGCGLVRDYTCFKAEKDYGKMQTNAKEFEPYSIDFPIFVFTDKTIAEFTTIFYQEVQKIKATK